MLEILVLQSHAGRMGADKPEPRYAKKSCVRAALWGGAGGHGAGTRNRASNQASSSSSRPTRTTASGEGRISGRQRCGRVCRQRGPGREDQLAEGREFSTDGGLRAGQPVGSVDFLVDGGDITNRAEGEGPSAIQSAAEIVGAIPDRSAIEGPDADRTGVAGEGLRYPLPGNHDVSNAIGYPRVMTPATDKAAMVEIYNSMMWPATPKTPATYSYPHGSCLTSRMSGSTWSTSPCGLIRGSARWLEDDSQGS